MLKNKIEERIIIISKLLEKLDGKIFIAYSGGKDSTAVLKLLFESYLRTKSSNAEFEIIYCDTGVENPVIDRYVHNCLSALEQEFKHGNWPFSCKILHPETKQTYLVRVIGRGYPPPTNSFRWCTKDTRIRPVKHFIQSQGRDPIIAVGTRYGESTQRDRTLRKSEEDASNSSFFQKQRDGYNEAVLFTPIIDFDVDDVWEALITLEKPIAIPTGTLVKLYKDGGAECPAIRDFKDKPCSKARFGCWTCTVVRKDKSAQNMIAEGYVELIPFLEFRDWLVEIRNKPEYRCKYRRNGREGLGPFNLYARQVIFDRLKKLENEVGYAILSQKQEDAIKMLWQKDLESDAYAKLE